MRERAYMAWGGGDPGEGACVVFAVTAAEAKKLAWPVVEGWTGVEWTDLRVKWLRGDCNHLRAIEGPHVNESPPACERCHLWFAEPLTNGLCEGCQTIPNTA